MPAKKVAKAIKGRKVSATKPTPIKAKEKKMPAKKAKKVSAPVLPAPPANRKPDVPRDEAGRFPPGVSGNPSGRPKSKPMTDAYRAILATVMPGDKEGRTYGEIIALAAVHKAAKGSLEHLRELTDRVEGRAVQSHHLSGREGGPIEVANLTPEQRDAELASLAAELGYRRDE